jgi:hypothetical protein
MADCQIGVNIAFDTKCWKEKTPGEAYTFESQ